jgi:hypothetical protein
MAKAEEGLCFGWIDGQNKRRDDESYVQRMTPRRPKSPWSASNIDRVARLEAEGKMHAAGTGSGRGGQGRRSVGGSGGRAEVVRRKTDLRTSG